MYGWNKQFLAGFLALGSFDAACLTDYISSSKAHRKHGIFLGFSSQKNYLVYKPCMHILTQVVLVHASYAEES